jgi:hypothetical protein
MKLTSRSQHGSRLKMRELGELHGKFVVVSYVDCSLMGCMQCQIVGGAICVTTKWLQSEECCLMEAIEAAAMGFCIMVDITVGRIYL